MGRGSKHNVQPIAARSSSDATAAAAGAKQEGTTSSSKPSGGGGGTNVYTWPIVIVIVVIVAYVWQTRVNAAPLEDLSNVDVNVLKQTIFGSKPYLFYCDRRQRGEKIPESFEKLRHSMHPKVGFATVNCSQQVVAATDEAPVPVTMWDKFKLKREWRPAVFASAPWMRLKQIPPDVLGDRGSGAGGMSRTLHKFVDVDMRPQATHVVTDNDFLRHCGFSGKSKNTGSSTCIILIKGAKYGAAQEDLEAKLVTKYTKTKFARVAGSTTSFNFDKQLAKTLRGGSTSSGKKKGSSLPHHSEYALRVVAIRDGQHYLPMTYSPTWNYIDTFVAHAINAPTSDFTGYNLPSPTAAEAAADEEENASAKATTEGGEEGAASDSDNAVNSNKSNDRSPTIHMFKKGSGFKTRRSAPVHNGNSGSSSSSSSSSSSMDDAAQQELIDDVRRRREERKRERRERELQRAEEMQKESLNRLFEDDDGDEGSGDEKAGSSGTGSSGGSGGDSDDEGDEDGDYGSDQDEDEEMIEL